MPIRSPLLLLATLLLLPGCATVEPVVEAKVVQATVVGATTETPADLVFNDAARFGIRPAIPTMDELLTLTPAQQAAFLAYLNDPLLQRQPLNQRVANYLRDFTADFNYQGDTLSAAEAFTSNSGNCMSLALMTTAVADLAGVRIGYQLLDDIPVFEYRGTVVQKGYHVRSTLYGDKKLTRIEAGARQFSRTDIKVDYFETEQARFVANLTREAFLAMYYGNIAADAVAAQDYNKAYWYARESLQQSPANPVAVNTLAVVSRRTGDAERAEQLYRYGIAHADEKLSLLKNYQTLLQSQGRVAEASQIALQLESMDDPSPFNWLQLARTAADSGEYDAAIRYYRRALTMAPYMHEAWLGIAQSQHEMGFDTAAITSLRKALDNVYRDGTRKLYKAKLYSLTEGKS